MEKEVVRPECGSLRPGIRLRAEHYPEVAWSHTLHGLQHLRVATELNQEIGLWMPRQLGVPRLVGPGPQRRRRIHPNQEIGVASKFISHQVALVDNLVATAHRGKGRLEMLLLAAEVGHAVSGGL